jgi:hypothetical protein
MWYKHNISNLLVNDIYSQHIQFYLVIIRMQFATNNHFSIKVESNHILPLGAIKICDVTFLKIKKINLCK